MAPTRPDACATPQCESCRRKSRQPRTAAVLYPLGRGRSVPFVPAPARPIASATLLCYPT
ncbi:hypothetical protein E2562_024532 [Oryza meyeriana var. granulata]|uniref:Uncharacterized protein n=1 Tax=Oryza meyeriana var. granulata TaxID=110450 RepID=A0A6G1BQ07_9ORYZ|nr:hypothetical protein E2562_024532 [Oryza meyeriana var. granulata]